MKSSRLTVAPATAQKLARLGLVEPMDLVLHLPLRYEDETRITAIADAPYQHSVQIEGEVRQCEVRRQPRKQLRVLLADASGAVWLRFLHFYPSQEKLCAVGQRLRAVGEVRRGFQGDEMVHPKIHAVGDNDVLPEAMTPVYPTVQGLNQSTLRRLIGQALALEDLSDTLPAALRAELALPDFADAVHTLHHPPPDCAQQALALRRLPAWQRLKFDELLAQQLAMRILYRQRRHGGSPRLCCDGRLRQALLAQLPFALTAAQQRVLA